MKKETLRWIAALFAVAVLSPGVVFATAGQIVNISDPTTSATAVVDVKSLRVIEVAPTWPIFAAGTMVGTSKVHTVTSVGTGRMHVTNVNLTVVGTTSPVSVSLARYYYEGDQPLCSTTIWTAYTVLARWVPVGGQGMVPLTYTPGMAPSAGKQCLKITVGEIPAGTSVHWSITGFRTAT